MSEREEFRALADEHDDGRPWGWLGNPDGSWRAIPKTPLLLAGFGPPPFEVKLPDGSRREIIHQPEGGA